MKPFYPYYLGSKPVQANKDLVVRDKYTGDTACLVAKADSEAINTAIELAVAAEPAMKSMPIYNRHLVLDHCVKQFTKRYDELAMALCIEAGKPIRDSRGEVDRLIETFKIAAEEVLRPEGAYMDLGRSARTTGYSATLKRFPVGACAFISPFNFPLNLVAHKIAPAIAAGCPFVLKPASLTPVGAIIIGEVLAETDLPHGSFSILPCDRTEGSLLVEDNRLKLLSFTGSPDVGWDMKKNSGKKKVVLELGGNAACVVEPDWDIDDAVSRIIVGAFYQSGQSCISVQKIYVHDDIYDEFKEKLTEITKGLIMGDPKNEETFIGPMITEKEAGRLSGWVSDAVSAGGVILTGGNKNGAFLEPTLMADVPESEKICAEEAFGPVAVLSRYKSFSGVLETINSSRFGLQAGIFTRDIYKADEAWEQLDVGGVVIGDIPSWRADQMPYGGIKDSGLGREGIISAMEDMTEPKIMVVRHPR